MTATQAAERQALLTMHRAGLSAEMIARLRDVLGRVSTLDVNEPGALGTLRAEAKIALIYLNVDLELQS